MPVMRVCDCGQTHPRDAPCPERERRRNSDPNRKAHRTQAYKRLRDYVLWRDARICGICHRPGADTLDFVVPLAHGGVQVASNARAAHRSCNSREGATVRRP